MFFKHCRNIFIPPHVLVRTAEREEIIDLQLDEAAKIKHKESLPFNLSQTMTFIYPTLDSKSYPSIASIFQPKLE